MYVEDMVVKDILELKYEASNIQHDATLQNMYEWYTWALNAGIIEVAYRYGELLGFLEWVRLPHIPATRDSVIDEVNYEDFSGPVLYIANCCIRDDKRHGTMWKLAHMAKEKNPDVEYFCWHNEDGTMKLYETNKEGVEV